MKKIVNCSSLLIAFFVSFVSLVYAPLALAAHHHRHHAKQPIPHIVSYKGEALLLVDTFVPNWYVGGNLGLSRTHDKKAAGTTNDSVTQIGPGWSVDVGYQFVKVYRATLAGELGYTQYYHSAENAPGANIANTDHFSSYGALVAQCPLVHHFSILGKLGIAYSYAKKVFVASGASASANTYSPYYGVGFAYNVTPQASFILQWARARGNHSTGSTDLTSFGVAYNFI